MTKVYYCILLALFLFLFACESPLKIQVHELDNVNGSSFNRAVLKSGGDCSIGYYNGNIQTSCVKLSWSQTTEDEFMFYKVMRDNQELAVFNHRSFTTLIDSLVMENSSYDYQITVFANNGMVATDTIEILTPKWQPPSNVTANGLNDTDVLLMWDDNTDSEENFRVLLQDVGPMGNYEEEFIVEKNITQLIVTVPDNTGLPIYSVQVMAFNQWEMDTEYSQSANFNMTDFALYAPSGLTCSQNIDMYVELNWYDNSTMETGFCIERKINDLDFCEIADIDTINTIAYLDMDVSTYNIGDSLTYRIRAYNDYENLVYTDYSMEATLIITDPPPTPEYYYLGNTYELLAIDYSGETDVVQWMSSGSDLDIYLDNYSMTMDLAVRIWTESGEYLGEFNDNGTGADDSFPNIGYNDVYIIEIFDVNNSTGSYNLEIN